jgi:thymidylate synthase (FAD)
MKVELLDHMGSDLDVVNAARVSFDKESDWESTFPGVLSERDTKLISYLAKHHHWTPFSHCYAKFRIKAPLFVRSQLFKHKVGLTENEVSRRYVDSEPEFYVPEVWRKRAEDKKQGSTEEPVNLSKLHAFYCDSVNNYGSWDDYSLSELETEHRERTLILYNSLLKVGVCPEQARMVLPQSIYTEWIWSGSIAAFARVYQQRTSDHAQHETKQIALQIGELLQPLFPVSWSALCDTSSSH